MTAWRPRTALDADAAPPSLTSHLLARRDEDEPEDDVDVALAAREAVAGLRHRLLAVPSSSPPPATSRRAMDDADAAWRLAAARPLQVVAGLLVGVCVGASLAAMALLRAAPTANGLSPARAFTKWCRDRARIGRYYAAEFPSHAVPFPLDDFSYFVHPPAIEVA